MEAAMLAGTVSGEQQVIQTHNPKSPVAQVAVPQQHTPLCRISLETRASRALPRLRLGWPRLLKGPAKWLSRLARLLQRAPRALPRQQVGQGTVVPVYH
jgi:hypothetical protein